MKQVQQSITKHTLNCCCNRLWGAEAEGTARWSGKWDLVAYVGLWAPVQVYNIYIIHSLI